MPASLDDQIIRAIQEIRAKFHTCTARAVADKLHLAPSTVVDRCGKMRGTRVDWNSMAGSLHVLVTPTEQARQSGGRGEKGAARSSRQIALPPPVEYVPPPPGALVDVSANDPAFKAQLAASMAATPPVLVGGPAVVVEGHKVGIDIDALREAQQRAAAITATRPPTPAPIQTAAKKPKKKAAPRTASPADGERKPRSPAQLANDQRLREAAAAKRAARAS